MSISERLAQAMKSAGFQTQKALERASGVKQPTINRILNRPGSKGPESATVRLLAQACGVSFDWLNGGSDSEDSAPSSASAGNFDVDVLFGERVKALREAAGMTQTDLAERMGVSPQGVQKWESGASSPRFSRLYGLSEVLGVPVSHLLPDDPKLVQPIDPDDLKLRMLASRLRALSDEKRRALAVILEVTLS
jgi:transcriptional regulator with XRE-family HTH domain